MRRVALGTGAGLVMLCGAIGFAAAATGDDFVGAAGLPVAATGDARELAAIESAAPGTKLAAAGLGFLVLGGGAASVAAKRR